MDELDSGGLIFLKKALVIGGAGFVGASLVRRLASANDCEITVVDKFIFGNGLAGITLQNVHVVEGDASDSLFLADVLQRGGFDVVYHLAANSDIRASVNNPSIDVVNTFGTTFALSLALSESEVRVPILVFSSTSAIFGNHSEPIHAKSVKKPESAYGWMKLASEHALAQLSQTALIGSLRIIRFPNVTGAGQTHGVVKDLCAKAYAASEELPVLGDGRQSKPYVHVDELVEAIIRFASESYSGSLEVNFAPSDQIRVSEIAELVVSASGRSLRLQFQDKASGWPGDVANYSYDLQNLPEQLSSALTLSSREAVAKSVAEEFAKLNAS